MNVDWQKFRTDERYQTEILFQTPEYCDRSDILGKAYCVIFYKNISLLSRVRNQHIDMCRYAVSINPEALKYINIDLPDEFYINVLKRLPTSFKWMINPSNKVCKHAVSFNGLNLQHVKYKTHEIQLRAVRTTPEAIVWCHKPTKKLRWMAISRNPTLITSIGGRSQSMVLSAIQDDLNLHENSNLINQIPKKFTRAHEYVKLLRA